VPIQCITLGKDPSSVLGADWCNHENDGFAFDNEVFTGVFL
jgi:hypothetical protein